MSGCQVCPNACPKACTPQPLEPEPLASADQHCDPGCSVIGDAVSGVQEPLEKSEWIVEEPCSASADI